MKKRMIKKIAKKYLTSNKTYLPYGTYIEEYQAYNDGSPVILKEYAYFPLKIREEINRNITNLNKKNHWDDPLLISIDDEELRAYEKEYNPSHCW